MSQMESNTKNTGSNKSGKATLILGILLLLSAGGNIYQYFNTKEIIVEREKIRLQSDTMALRKLELEKEVEKVSLELNQFQGRSAELDSLLAEANGKIAEQKSQINRLINENKDYDILKMRYLDLQKLKDQYLKQIEDLIAENKQLKYENTELSVKVDKLNEEKQQLNNKVEQAGVLKVQNIRLRALQVKGNGKIKEVEKASRADRINIRFTILENKLAKNGPKTAYVRIINPQGFVVADVSQSTKKFSTREGKEMTYSRAVDFEYAGVSSTQELDFGQETFSKGNYTFEIYIDGEFAGSEVVLLD